MSALQERKIVIEGYRLNTAPKLHGGRKAPTFANHPRLSVMESIGEQPDENAIVYGDNLQALNILAPLISHQVRCIYIDPPYNNQESYTHYMDALSHDDWMGQIEPRLKMLWGLLSVDGSLWVSIDDREMHYLKVLLDRICGRDSFVSTIVWEHRISRENRKAFSNNHEYLIVYAKSRALFTKRRHLLPLTPDILKRYQNPDDDPRGPWQSVSLNVQAGHGTAAQFYTFTAPNARTYAAPKGRCWMFTKERMLNEIREDNVWFGKDGRGVPRLKRFLHQTDRGLTPETLWRAEDVGTTSDAKKHQKQIFPRHKRLFDTPKPESLLQRILHVATNPGDLVLDCYLGSGTTAAVAHKMGRRYIGIERNADAMKMVVKRLKSIVVGDEGGISGDTGWHGGRGFTEYKLK
ncbi:MAG: site-specific DNA-methyltransferase [Vulcanimicrobiaceae bacterium]